MRWVSDERLYVRSLELLFSQFTGAFISSAIVGLVLIYTFWNVSNPVVSLLWVIGYSLVAGYRIYLRSTFYACDKFERHKPRWFACLGVSIFATGLLWGVFLFYLALFAEGILAAILMANMAFLLAGAVSAYAISLPVFVLFSFPIVAPAVGYLALSMENDNWMLAAVSLGWYLFMVSTARRFGEFAMRALGYEYENQELVGELEEQNRRAEVLAQELMVLSNTDSLTGLYNRRFFDECLDAEIARSHRTGAPLSLLLCDVDYFKKYNDILGHIEGDKCLKSIAEILMDSVRDSTDVVARYGGEEFGVVLTNTTIAQGQAFAERLGEALAESAIPHPGSDIGPHITMSIGIASIGDNLEDDAESLIARADKALYRAKEYGRNQVCLQIAS